MVDRQVAITFFKVVARATVGKFGRIWQPTGHNFEPCVYEARSLSREECMRWGVYEVIEDCMR